MKIKHISNLPIIENCTICIIGLGYVGLPLAIEFSKIKRCLRTGTKLNRDIIGFDLNEERIKELKLGLDTTKETEEKDLNECKSIEFTSDLNKISIADVFIISVPTPIDIDKNPDLNCLEKATESIGKILKTREKTSIPVIIYESTVYPGTTEEICVPILEEKSGLKFNEGFSCGYSPERINPGDKEHRLTSIVKVTSGSNEITAKWVDDLYGSIIGAGTYPAKSIQVAEAAKVIENTQRDLNIALINELAKIFKTIKIDTLDVLEAAGSKWNFMPFRPGLVGGHCISVDPFYLTYKAKKHGYEPNIVLAGRNLNDGMSEWIVEQLLLAIKEKKINQKNAKILILGLTFKENCPDTRNSKVMDIIFYLNQNGLTPYVHDPYIENEIYVKNDFIFLNNLPTDGSTKFDAIIVSVAHQEFKIIDINQWINLMNINHVIYDLKGIIPRELKPMRL